MRSGDKTVWFLTGNPDKFREASSIVAPYGVTLRPLRQPKSEVQSSKPEKIARLALEEGLKDHDKAIVVEDSGLFIRTLGGFPGPYSSYVYNTLGLKGILALLRLHGDRSAYFQSTVAFGNRSAKPRLFTGRVRGTIARRIAGHSGFGYDPIFIPDGLGLTFGQSSSSLKNERSHRAKAFRKFARWFATENYPANKRHGKIALK